MGLYDEQIAGAQMALDKDNEKRRVLETKRIQCANALKPYVEKLFADRAFEKFLFDSKYEISFYSASGVLIDARGLKADVSYSITGIGVTKKIDADILLKEEHYFFGRPNSVNSLVIELASISNGEFTSDMLEQKITSFLEEKRKAATQ